MMAEKSSVLLQRIDYLLDICDQSMLNSTNISHSKPILSLRRLSTETQEFLESYTKESIFEIMKKSKYFRKKALEVSDYRCIKHNLFMRPAMIKHPIFKTDIKPLLASSNTNVLDIGCCFGADLRYILYCGCSKEQIFGVDINAQLIDLGFDFFSDRDSLKDRFIAMDVLAKNGNTFIETALKMSKGKAFDIIFLGNIFHLLTEDECKLLTQIVFKLIEPQKGIIFGSCIGADINGIYSRTGRANRYLHELFKRNDGKLTYLSFAYKT